MDHSLKQQLKNLLEEERNRLERELAAIAAPDPAMKGDWDTVFPAGSPLASGASHSSQEEQADLREEFETGLAQEQSLESRLAEVKGAIARLETGAFGVCRAMEHAFVVSLPDRL